ncbi:uncharacterized protein ASCRUDRAFT_74402 [Ascoidea rubescens DSM 1968]|uniref:Uncharacterized protein n=1 Tax=Ascoidea rubescens DSM 1968 TaxID=1344418 RepID=A0A1D2VN04_9ASCO|nr:hypothetical protein ASCRUDRAFT_74402 [Ascoidea rubescens DSM 1968]ODV62964.1 hypothetical protein ASCRUDRAFT_74402 [Ascoidea rubescens DSM 1968]
MSGVETVGKRLNLKIKIILAGQIGLIPVWEEHFFSWPAPNVSSSELLNQAHKFWVFSAIKPPEM